MTYVIYYYVFTDTITKWLIENHLRNLRIWLTNGKSVNVIMGGDFNIALDSWLDRKPQRSTQAVYNDTILNLCTKTNVVDYWRITNPNSVQFNPSGNGQCSRL